MSDAKQIYSLIAKRQANSVDAIAVATGLSAEQARSVIDHLRREGLIERGSEYRPAMYSATFGSEPPKPAGRRPYSDPVKAAVTNQHPLAMAWR